MDSGGGNAAVAALEQLGDRPLQALLERYRLPSDAAAKLGRLLGLLATERTAPTAIRSAQRILDDHLSDSLVALEVKQVTAAARAADLGSGAGLPGLPLAIALPGLEVSLVESSRRKCGFIERAVAVCEASNARVVCERAEAWRDGLGRMELVTARALGPLPVVVEYGAPLLRVGGALVAWRGRREAEAEEAAASAARRLALELLEVRPVRPYADARNRHLYIWLKVGETPPGFPRRPGMARKRPLS